MKKYIIILSFLYLNSCGDPNISSKMEFSRVISYVQNEEERKVMNTFYINNRLEFWKAALEHEPTSTEKLEQLLQKEALNDSLEKKALKILTDFSKQHRKETNSRDSIYSEGVICLQNLIDDDVKEFINYIKHIQKQILPIIDKSYLKKLSKLFLKHTEFVERKQLDFKNANEMMLGELGTNITNYNFLSFEMIKKIHCTEYDFDTKRKAYKLSEQIFNESPELAPFLKDYIEKEKSIVSKINSNKCKKRIGILRHYDELNAAGELKTHKANMLFNIIREASKN